MRKPALVLLFLLVSISTQAKYYRAKLIMKDNPDMIGFVSSFMENNILKKLKPGKNIKDQFNLEDTTIKFKSSSDAEDVLKIDINDIEELMFFEGPYEGIRFRPLFVGGVNKKGELELTKKRMWLPLLIDDKVRIFGFSYSEYSQASSGTSYLHFIQHPQKDFAIQPLSELGFMQMKGEVITGIALNEMKVLLEDCPESYASLEALANGFKVKEERKKLRKGLKEMRSAAIKKFLSDYPNYGMSLRMFANNYWIICESLYNYNNLCDMKNPPSSHQNRED